MDQELIKEYNQFRRVSSHETMCPAPSMNLHFSQLGIVTACCFNRTQVLGVYPETTLDDIWASKEVRKMRDDLQNGHFPSGCEKCREQIMSRDFGGSYASFYSHQAKILSARKKEINGQSDQIDQSSNLPLKLEFNIHNACNLQCIMCHGLASSSIRLHREGLPAMPNPYDDAFVDQLKRYLPHVVETDFMGGEPFMVAAYQKIWEAISEINPQIKTIILTNATILNDSIKALLKSFNCWIHVSIDSFKKPTYEAIRKGASFETVMENCAYFNQLMKSKGHHLIWRYCPMRINWQEIPETVTYCSEQDIKLSFNQVDSPIDMSLTTLPEEELRTVIDTLRAHEPTLPPTEASLENIQNYRDLIHRLSGFLQSDNRSNALRSRLQAAEAVVGQYSPRRERTLKRRVKSENINEQLSPLVRGYLINRLNIGQAEQTNTHVDQEAKSLLDSSLRAVLELTDSLPLEQKMEIYLKELMRVISGVWGVTKVHNREIFKQIEEVVQSAEKDDFQRLRADWNRLLVPEPQEVYQNIAHAQSSEAMRHWLNSL